MTEGGGAEFAMQELSRYHCPQAGCPIRVPLV